MAGTTEVKIFKNPTKTDKAVAREIYNLATSKSQGPFHIAISGGNTPKKLFSILSKKYKKTIPWKYVHLWWVDERCVPSFNEQSNYKTANDFLLSKIKIPQKNIHRINGEAPPTEESKRYSQEIKKYLHFNANLPVFDLILLGIGNDGHTASIFPGQLNFFHTTEICTVSKHPETQQRRITLTGTTINNASRIFILATGKKKSLPISKIMNNNNTATHLPVYYITPKNGLLIWFIDEPAASKI